MQKEGPCKKKQDWPSWLELSVQRMQHKKYNISFFLFVCFCSIVGIVKRTFHVLSTLIPTITPYLTYLHFSESKLRPKLSISLKVTQVVGSRDLKLCLFDFVS